MYSKSVFNFFENCPHVLYYKNGELFGSRIHGEFVPARPQFPAISHIELTRAQGFKYWEKYFPNRTVWELPLPLQEAIDRDCVSFGEFVDKNGELVGYAG